MTKTTSTAPDKSFVETHEGGGTSFVGPDAVNLMRAIHLKAALSLYAKTGMKMTRNATPTVMLAIAKQYTGKTYKQPGRTKYAEAAADVVKWVETMKAAIPITHKQAAEE